jgi:multidrug transporter EmrE-like cation transporter
MLGMAILALLVVLFSIASTSAAIQFKLSSASAGGKALWHFILGNLIGVLGPVTLTLALRRGHPNLVYARCYGCAFTLLQIVSWRLFQQPLSPLQWTGAALVGVGILLLQIRQA